MIKRDFQLVNYDTDSVTICNKDFSSFSEEQKIELIEELNSLFDENIIWEDDGYYETIIVIRAKNYILEQAGKIKVKGSGLKSSKKAAALKEFTNKVIEIMVRAQNEDIMKEDLKRQYSKYVDEILNISEIKRWSARKTLSSTMMESERTNEKKAQDAIKGSDYREGDRFHTFYLEDDSLCLAENFKGNYNKVRLLKKFMGHV